METTERILIEPTIKLTNTQWKKIMFLLHKEMEYDLIEEMLNQINAFIAQNPNPSQEN